MSLHLFVYDGHERYVESDTQPTMNRVIAIQKPLDDREQRQNVTLRMEDMKRYRVVATSSELHEVQNGIFKTVSVVKLEEVEELV